MEMIDPLYGQLRSRAADKVRQLQQRSGPETGCRLLTSNYQLPSTSHSPLS
jgi:hypothetical protein